MENESSPETSEPKDETSERRERYSQNLENLRNLELDEIYPVCMERKSWEVVEDPAVIDQFYDHFRSEWRRLPAQIYSIYREQETGQLFTTFRDGVQSQVILDLLFAHKKIAPWSPVNSFVLAQSSVPSFEQKGNTLWQPKGTTVAVNGPVLEYVVNNLGDPQKSIVQKKNFLTENVSTLIHEAVHCKNEPGGVGGSQYPAEVDATLAEYLVFSGNNPKNRRLVGRSLEILHLADKKQSRFNILSKALAIGLLIIGEEEGMSPRDDDPLEFEEFIKKIDAHIAQMPDRELGALRKRAEDLYLSDEDEKMEGLIERMERKYPRVMEILIS